MWLYDLRDQFLPLFPNGTIYCIILHQIDGFLFKLTNFLTCNKKTIGKLESREKILAFSIWRVDLFQIFISI